MVGNGKYYQRNDFWQQLRGSMYATHCLFDRFSGYAFRESNECGQNNWWIIKVLLKLKREKKTEKFNIMKIF